MEDLGHADQLHNSELYTAAQVSPSLLYSKVSCQHSLDTFICLKNFLFFPPTYYVLKTAPIILRLLCFVVVVALDVVFVGLGVHDENDVLLYQNTKYVELLLIISK